MVKNMPGFDRTGPRGLGSMTGGGRGFCTGFLPRLLQAYPQYYASHHYRYTPYTYPAPSLTPYPFRYNLPRGEELRMLESHAKFLEQQLEEIRRRIAELEK
jgi:hypothetical protein